MQKWGQENEGEKSYYISSFPKRCRKWIKYQKELFQRYNPINACDIEEKITPYDSRIYFNQPNLTGFGGMSLISFLRRLTLEGSSPRHLIERK